jgi:hypothetical protein
VLCLLLRAAELHQDRAEVIDPLNGKVWRSKPRQFLGQDDLLAEARPHAAIGLGPVRRDPAALGDFAVPRHQLGRRRTRGPSPQWHGQVGFEPAANLLPECCFSRRILAKHLWRVSWHVGVWRVGNLARGAFHRANNNHARCRSNRPSMREWDADARVAPALQAGQEPGVQRVVPREYVFDFGDDNALRAALAHETCEIVDRGRRAVQRQHAG